MALSVNRFALPASYSVSPVMLAKPQTFASQDLLSNVEVEGQFRMLSTKESNDDADEGEPTLISSESLDEEDLDDLLYNIDDNVEKDDRPRGINMNAYLKMDNQDTLELLVQTRDSFMKKDTQTIPIPLAVREVMYRHRWDKIIVDVRRVVYRTKNGKREQYTAMVASGNQKGLLGLGMGNAETAQLAVARAYLDSFSNLAAVPLYRAHTVFHRVNHQFQKVVINISPRPAGFGLVCSNLLFEICSMAGLRDATIKIRGATRNKFFVAKAFFDALQSQTAPQDGVEGTGMYIREVIKPPVLSLGTYRNSLTLPPKEYLRDY
eukprot:CAMPEP_0175064544 /NCGR_PEP_ID=MMETSP0052_2-20121109/15396_1 /TAXON_ID=51329 ORGANISM="Polytomella parva, Strain SAG 63-3" /NCGR_SAMPLE_ID=MMETSP0052_2 /ASSEMBLY_ACC=CAM_ASM_000194 /LENGTH=320 /DNA_ID=CAMNT_0016330915 /DNA_START=139 /DNA_END=1100 /DNA_ORIENTATION=+